MLTNIVLYTITPLTDISISYFELYLLKNQCLVIFHSHHNSNML